MRDVDEFAKELLQDGMAISAQQAGWMASILLDQSLSVHARIGLFTIAKAKGADFHPADITQEEIKAAVAGLQLVADRVALFLCDPAGRA